MKNNLVDKNNIKIKLKVINNQVDEEIFYLHNLYFDIFA
jgi:hypothetical protein